MTRLALITVLVVAATSCSAQQPAEPGHATAPRDDTTTVLPFRQETAAAGRAVTMLAVGDIASCPASADEEVAALARARSGVIAIPGDAVYEKGTLQEYRECFDPAWGPMYDRLRPAAGNHDYLTTDAGGFFEYFDERIGRPGRGWYAFDVGPHWRGIVLNSNCSAVGGCGVDSAQGRWLARALERARRRHVVAVMHHPRFSTGSHGSQLQMKPLFRLLYRAGAPLLLAGHDHMYERFAPQNHRGERRRRGVRQFTVGTGGRTLYDYSRAPLPTTQVRNNTAYGLLRLRLRADGYSWRFISTNGSFSDSGRKRLPLR